MNKSFSLLVVAIVVVSGLFIAQLPNKKASDPLTLSPQLTGQAKGLQIDSLSSLSPNSYQVTRVIDGDTIELDINSKIEKVRLIGINTPESVDPRRSVECFGQEASAKTKALTEGKEVYIASDPDATDRDRYGRLLRYIFLPDGRHLNAELIREGYATEYTYNRPYRYQAEFRQLEKEAQAAKRGLWADAACMKAPSRRDKTKDGPMRDADLWRLFRDALLSVILKL